MFCRLTDYYVVAALRFTSLAATFFLVVPSWAAVDTKLRGANVPEGVGVSDIAELGDWNANIIRFQIVPSDTPPYEPGTPEYSSWYSSEVLQRIYYLESLLPYCQQRGLKVLVDLHRPPGALRDDIASYKTLFKHVWAQTLFMDLWSLISQHLAGQSMVWGYDLLNEPLGSNAKWRVIAQECASRIRDNDGDVFIVVEPHAANPNKMSGFAPLNGNRIVYSVHFYIPMAFTHQLNPDLQLWSYPGTINGQLWNKATVRQRLQPVEDYQNAHGVRILVGEFAAARWSDGSSPYMRDVIEVAEEFGWDWCYHAFRESDVWDLELGNDPNNHTRLEETQKEVLMKTKMAANE